MMKGIMQYGFVLLMFAFFNVNGQSIHFSQYYNAPLLLNPANTALMPDNDFRFGVNYRNQWAVVPVPYNTFSAFGDFKIGGHKNPGHSSWLGIGFSIFSDKAGDGSLSLTQLQGSAAYHLRFSEHAMLSLGFSYATVQRSVNYDKLTFDGQWDGVEFNPTQPNNEKNGIIKDNYYTVGSGINLALFPNDRVYIQFSGGAANINQPYESFYNLTNNKLAIRPMGDIDMMFRAGNGLIVNPSMYYETQSGASELIAGTIFRTDFASMGIGNSQLILGIFDRLNDAVIGVAGYQYANVQFVASYDFTTSALSPYNGAYGALEFSIVYSGTYNKSDRSTRMFTCPRFF